jgi:hypothetical protein
MGAPVKGLGLILNQPSVPTIALAVGVPTVTLGSLGAYHTFKAMGAVKSGWSKTGLFIGGLLSALVSLDGAILTLAGLKQLVAPSTDNALVITPSNLPSNVAAIRRLRGIGKINAQPEMMVGQDHWLDRDYPDRYSEWWVGNHPRR